MLWRSVGRRWQGPFHVRTKVTLPHGSGLMTLEWLWRDEQLSAGWDEGPGECNCGREARWKVSRRAYCFVGLRKWCVDLSVCTFGAWGWGGGCIALAARP